MDTNGTTHNGQSDDPFDSATNATLAPRSYYGQIQADAWFCALVKGTGKVPFDPTQHNPEQRCVAVDISLIPLPEQNVRFDIRRETIAESREWAGIIWPSLKALGLTNAREADGKWGKLTQVPSGRKYRNSAGEEKEATTFKFLALYPNEDACRDAYHTEVKRQPADAEPAPTQAPQSTPAGGNGGNGSKARETAVQFIAAFAKMNKYDVDATRRQCAGQPAITNVVDVNTPEFVEIIAQAAHGQ